MQKLKSGLAISGTSKRQDDTGFNDSSILACAECHRDLYGKTAYAISPASNPEQVCCTGQLIESYPSRLACFQSSCHFSWSFLYESWSFLYDFMLFCCCLFTCPVCKLLVSVKPFSFVFRISLGRVVPLTQRECSLFMEALLSLSVTEGIKSCYGRKRSSWQKRCVQQWILRQDKVKSEPWEQRFTECK